MTDKHFITGSKGPKTPKPPRKDPDTLKSITTIKVQDLLSEGELEGFATSDKRKSVYLDDTPMVGLNGSSNVDGATLEFRSGSPVQSKMAGFVTTTKLLQTPAAPLTPSFTSETIGQEYDSATITIQLDSLYEQWDNGDLTGYAVSFVIYAVSIDTTIQLEAITRNIEGKTMSPYQETFEIMRPDPTQNWYIQVENLSYVEDQETRIGDSMQVVSITGEESLGEDYKNSALVGFTYEASQQGQNIPKRSYELKGVKVQVPEHWNKHVYDNATGEIISFGYYDPGGLTGFKEEWSDDPAWIIYDLLINKRYGLGIEPQFIDVNSFYQASLYNMEPVNYEDEYGITQEEPRFRFNGVIQKRENGMKMVQAIASVCRAVLYTATGGIIRMLQDRPTTHSKYITHSNVINGEFVYEGTEYLARLTSCQVTFSDSKDRFLPKTIGETSDQLSIDKYGLNTNDVTGYGITSESQARRLAKWILDTSLNQTQVVKFSVGWQNALLDPGEVVEIYDRTIQALEGSGLVTSGSTTTVINLDREVTLDSSSVYTLQVQHDDGHYEEANVMESNGDFSTLTLVTPLTFTPSPGRLWGLSNDAGQNPQQFKIQQITEAQPGQYEVLAIEYDPGKYARVEGGIITELPVYGDIGGFEMPAVENLAVVEEGFLDQNGVARLRLRLKWDLLPAENNVLGYIVKWRKDGHSYQTSEMLPNSEFILDDALPGTSNPGLQLPPGVYDFVVTAYNMRAVSSPPSQTFYTLEVDGATELNGPSNLILKPGTGSGTEFITKDLQVEWDEPIEKYNQRVVLESYQVDIYDATGADRLVRTVYVPNGTTNYDYPYELNVLDGGPFRVLRVDVSTRDSLQKVSDPITETFTNPSPAIQSFNLTEGLGQIWIDFLSAPESDHLGYVVARGPTVDFTPANNNVIWRGDSTYVSLEAEVNVLNYYKVAAYDLYDSDADSLTWSGSVGGTGQGVDDFEETSIQIQEVLFEPANPNNTLTWTAGTATKTSGVTVTSQNISTGSFNWTSGNVYVYYDYDTNTIGTTTNLQTAVTNGRIVLGNYKGGTDWTSGNGDAYMDGGRIIAQTIGATQIAAGAITTNELDANAVTSEKIAAGTILASDIKSGTITGVQISATDIIIQNSAQMGSATIGSAEIIDASIGTAEIANAAVTNAKIGNLAVNTAKISDASINTLKIQGGNVVALNVGNTSTSRSSSGLVSVGFNFSNAKAGQQAIINASVQGVIYAWKEGGTGSNQGITYQILRNGAVIRSQPASTKGYSYKQVSWNGQPAKYYNSQSISDTLTWVDPNPLKGYNTYQVRVKYSSGSYFTFESWCSSVITVSGGKA